MFGSQSYFSTTPFLTIYIPDTYVHLTLDFYKSRPSPTATVTVKPLRIAHPGLEVGVANGRHECYVLQTVDIAPAFV